MAAGGGTAATGSQKTPGPRRLGHRISRGRFARVMREHGTAGVARRRRPSPPLDPGRVTPKPNTR